MYDVNMVAETTLSWEALKLLLVYRPVTGKFYWLADRGKMKAGDEAGSVIRGIPYVRVCSSLIRTADLANFWMTANWKKTRPIDGDQTNTCWSNLETVNPKKISLKDEDAWLYAEKLENSWVVTGNLIPLELLEKLKTVLESKNL